MEALYVPSPKVVAPVAKWREAILKGSDTKVRHVTLNRNYRAGVALLTHYNIPGASWAAVEPRWLNIIGGPEIYWYGYQDSKGKLVYKSFSGLP